MHVLGVSKIIPVRTDRPLELYAQKKLHQHDKKGCMCGGFESACTAPRGLRCSPISLPNPARETCVPGLHLAVNTVFRNVFFFFFGFGSQNLQRVGKDSHLKDNREVRRVGRGQI